MKNIVLNLTDRKSAEEDAIRGVIYGSDLNENVNVAIPYNDLIKVYREAGSNQIVNAKIGSDDHEVLFKDLQLHPVTNEIIHFDLYAIKRGQKIKTEIPVTLVGDSPAEQKGASINQILDNLEIECIPSKLPDHFELDISVLIEIGDSLSVSDIKVDSDVEMLAEPESTVVKVEEIKENIVEDTSPEESTDEDGENVEDGEESESDGAEESAAENKSE